MNAILAFIPKPVFAGLVIALMLAVALQTWRVGSLSTELGAARLSIEQCILTNTTNKATIAEFERANKACIAGREVDEILIQKLAAEWNIEKELLQEQARNAQAQSIEVWRDPSCAELGKLDVAAICPDYADQLRQRAEDYNRD